MKVVAGRLTDEDRALVFESNRTGTGLLVATLDATVTYDQRRATPYTVAPMQAVGVVKMWDHDTFEIGGWSFATVIPWASAVKVWRRNEAPDEAAVDAIIAEHRVAASGENHEAIANTTFQAQPEEN